MSRSFRVACVQNCAEDDIDRNLGECTALVRDAVRDGADLVCLPEYFAALTPGDRETLTLAFTENEHPALRAMCALAAELDRWLLLGSIAIRVGDDRVNNRSYLVDASGAIAARYDKLHLFDVELERGEAYRESALVAPGTRAVVAPTPWGGLGLTVCYDVRFSYLYRALAQGGASFIATPAAFTRTTGEAHWHVLQRARAIETGSFIFAPGQCGVRRWGRATYGHSLIVDPWGHVLAEGGSEPGFVIAEVDPQRVTLARSMIPSLRHDRAFDGP